MTNEKNILLKQGLSIIGFDKLKMARFIFIGGSATLVHSVIALLLITVVSSVNLYLANSIAFGCAFFVSFYGHKHITFKKNGSILKFFMVSFMGFILNNTILTGAVYLGTSRSIGIIIATVSVPVVTYIVSSLWVFKSE